jgi:hypothetical protein
MRINPVTAELDLAMGRSDISHLTVGRLIMTELSSPTRPPDDRLSSEMVWILPKIGYIYRRNFAQIPVISKEIRKKHVKFPQKVIHRNGRVSTARF